LTGGFTHGHPLQCWRHQHGFNRRPTRVWTRMVPPNGVAYIMSLARMKDQHRVTFDSDNGNRFTIHKKDGSTRDFRKSNKGLYYIDTNIDAVALTVNTIDDNKSRYTNRDYSHALLARKIQDTIGRPSTRLYLHIINNNILPNCPAVTRVDVLAAEDILYTMHH
jgi:hypothetical protein